MSNPLSDILKKFVKCSLSDMDQVKLMNRVDTKYVLSKQSLFEILPELVNDYRCLEINNVSLLSYKNQYFDDDTFSCFQDHHRKIPKRFKVRIRKYIDTHVSFLEVKKKIKGRTNKSRIVVDDFVEGLDKQQSEFINKTIGESHVLSPTLWNDFQRITLVNNNNSERLTLDFNLTFEFNNVKKKYNNIVIAELKQSNVNRNSAFFKELKKRIIRPYRISKYCIGSMDINSKKIKTNRFKKKYLYINKLNNSC